LTTELPQALEVLASISAAVLVWDLATDAIHWQGDVAAVFPGIPPSKLASGAELARLIEPSSSLRRDALTQHAAARGGAAAPYEVEYGVRTCFSEPLTWIEESGSWFAGEDGRPLRAQAVVRVSNARHARQAALEKEARLDFLTGELNRAHLMSALTATIAEAARLSLSCAFMLIRIDHLDRLGDAFGCDVADAVMAATAARIRRCSRQGDVLGRFSDSVFGLILNSCSGDDVRMAGERILAAVRGEVVATRSGPVSVTASIGLVHVPRNASRIDEAVSRAQEALDASSRRSPGSFDVWRPNHARDSQRRSNIRVADQIITALNQRRVVLAFEPVVRADSRSCAFYECLVRMEQGAEVLLAPDIVPTAERLGLIRLLDHRVLELVLAELVASPEVELSLNVSPDSTVDPDWVAAIESLIRAHPGVGRRLIVEITETAAIRDIGELGTVVRKLKDLGCRIAIDDFGAGNTSFRNLRGLGVDIVKIDGAFVEKISRSGDDRAFVQAMIDLARRLDIRTVAEWVQDDDAARLLCDWGCDYLQGRLIGLAAVEQPWRAAAAALPAR